MDPPEPWNLGKLLAELARLTRRVERLEAWRDRMRKRLASVTNEIEDSGQHPALAELREVKDAAKWWRRTIVDKVLIVLIAAVTFLVSFLVSQLLKKG